MVTRYKMIMRKQDFLFEMDLLKDSKLPIFIRKFEMGDIYIIAEQNGNKVEDWKIPGLLSKFVMTRI